jgi:hypothetical protein
VYRDGRKRPLWYVADGAYGRGAVLGHYEADCGGCDTVGSARAVYELIQSLPDGLNWIVSEGLLLSEDVKWTTELAKTYDVRVAFLVTPITQCLEWVAARRVRAGNAKPFDPSNTVNRVGTIDRARVKLTDAGVTCRRCSPNQAPQVDPRLVDTTSAAEGIVVRDVIVVGGGVIGATVTKALRDIMGMNVLCLDDRRAGAGTPPSGGHVVPGWLRGMPDELSVPALATLDRVWGLITEEYVVSPGTSRTVHRVDTDAVVSYPITNTTCRALYGIATVTPAASYGQQMLERCGLLLVCAGIWCDELIIGLTMTGKRGVSYRVPGVLPHGPFIKPWAPYKQVVAHQHTPNEVWVGDGTTILVKNWTAVVESRSRDRCMAAMSAGVNRGGYRSITGVRPYCPPLVTGEPCYLAQIGPRCWIATGAGKCGTVAAGWVANRIMQELGGA